MSVRAKFRCTAIRRTVGSRRTGAKNDKGYDVYEPAELQTVEMAPVYHNDDPEHENSKFWDASPSGKLELGVINQAAWQEFELGREYYLDFTPAN